MTKQTRKSYTPEYKLEAIALVRKQGFSIGQAAAHLDLNHNILRRWLKEHDAQPFSDYQGKAGMTPEQKQLRDLEKRIRELEVENDILKKASSYFAKHMR